MVELCRITVKWGARGGGRKEANQPVQTGDEIPFLVLPTTSDGVKAKWLEALHALGCERATLG